MSKITFKFPFGITATDKITGFTGTINTRCQMINGCIQYGLQPKTKKNSHFIPDAYSFDEASITTEETVKNQVVDFAFDTGDRVKSRVNGFEGIIIIRAQHLNGCIHYVIEGGMKDGKEVKIKAWEPEIALIDKGLNAKDEPQVARKRTGGPHRCTPAYEKAI